MKDNIFGTRLKELRYEKGLTQLEVAKVLSVSKTTICKWETARQEPSIDDINKIAIFFNTSLDFLLGLSDYEFDLPKHITENKVDDELSKVFKKLTLQQQNSMLQIAKDLIKK